MIGSSDRLGGHPESDPQLPENMAATIYRTLGLPATAVWRDEVDRPQHVYFGGADTRTDVASRTHSFAHRRLLAHCSAAACESRRGEIGAIGGRTRKPRFRLADKRLCVAWALVSRLWHDGCVGRHHAGRCGVRIVRRAADHRHGAVASGTEARGHTAARRRSEASAYGVSIRRPLFWRL